MCRILAPDDVIDADSDYSRISFTSPMLKRQVQLIAASSTDIFEVREEVVDLSLLLLRLIVWLLFVVVIAVVSY